MSSTLPWLVPVAAILGWWLSRRRTNPTYPPLTLSRDYFLGLNYLLNEETDKAMDVFVKLLEVNSETVETHLALGNLFRRRGEVDRAIRLHQNIIARPHLEKQQRIQALLELGQDYLRAGVFDRAERLFLEVLELGGQTVPSLSFLLDIYQQEKDWERAIATAERLQTVSDHTIQPVIAHYYCELAIQCRAQGQLDLCLRQIKRALSVDRHCVRASLLQGELEVSRGHYKAAIRAYKRVREQDPDFLSEAVAPLVACYEQLGQHDALMAYLQDCLQLYPRVSIALLMVERLRQERGDKVATEFMVRQLRERPSLRGLDRLISLHLSNVDEKARENLLILQSITSRSLQDKPTYQCHQCGFSGRSLHWQCPSCKHWNVIKPILGLEGD